MSCDCGPLPNLCRHHLILDLREPIPKAAGLRRFRSLCRGVVLQAPGLSKREDGLWPMAFFAFLGKQTARPLNLCDLLARGRAT